MNNKNIQDGNSVMAGAMGAKSLFGRKVRNALKRMSTLVGHKAEKSKSIFAERKTIIKQGKLTHAHIYIHTHMYCTHDK